jgi:hypothetical protein
MPRLFAAVLLFAALPFAADATDAKPSDFFGRYVGQAVSVSGEDDLSKRDISVEIENAGRGAFIVTWMTFTRRDDGSRKRKSYSITFRASPRTGIYSSAMRSDKFGNAVPLDPMTGEPYVWARIHGKTLTIHALHITEGGGYELQTYDRTLTPQGLDLRFSRIRNGKILKEITGRLARVDE